MKVAIAAGISLVILAVLGLGGGPSAALGQRTAPGGSMTGMGMMSGMAMMGGPFSPAARPLSMDQAVQILRQWPARHDVQGVALDEVEAYTENYFGLFKEVGTGRGAFTLVVDRYTGQVMPEMGGNMMWNTKYGMMGNMGMMNGGGMMGGMGSPGMMGGTAAQPTPRSDSTSSASQISLGQARLDANRFLANYMPGAKTGDGDTFYGYYHFDVLRGGRQVGMLDVNAATGAVWYHTWHGESLGTREVGPS